MRGGNNFIDLTGQKYGRLTVIERAENTQNGNACWLCQCDCMGPNSLVIVRANDLKNGKTKSCGCLRDGHPKHGGCGTHLYNSYCNMMDRCYNENAIGYHNYGGRGIEVCDEWNNNFSAFREWAYQNNYDENAGLTIDRIDVNGNYCPENCRFATKKEQANNRRTNIMITYFDETHSLKEWCEILNLPYMLIQNRYTRCGWDFWTAISTPLPDHYYDGYYDESDYYDYNDYDSYYEDPSEYDSYSYY